MATNGDFVVSITPQTFNRSSFSEAKSKSTYITSAEVPVTPDETARAIKSVNTADTKSDRGPASGDQLTRIGAFFSRLFTNRLIRWALYIVPVAAFLCIPIILYATKYSNSRIGGVRSLGLWVWIETVWGCLWVAKITAFLIPYAFQYICGLFVTGIRKWSYVMRALEIPLSLFLWAAAAYASRSIVWTFDEHNPQLSSIQWLHTFTKVLKATIAVTAIYLGEKLVIQLVSSNYHSRQFDNKIKETKNLSLIIGYMYDASIQKYPQFHPDFFEFDSDLRAASELRKLGKRGTFQGKALDYLNMLSWYGDKYITSSIGSMASDITGANVLQPTASQSIVEKALESHVSSEALANRIFRAFVPESSDVLTAKEISVILGIGREKDADFIFDQLDRDDNGDVSQEEMIRLVTELSRQSKHLVRGACDVKDAIKVLDRVLSAFVLILMCLVYAAFFSSYLATKYTQIWTTFTGLSFLFSGTASELFAACILVFIKHPYDIGDRVVIEKQTMEVVRISLLYTIFRREESDTLVQIANSVANNLWIDNMTRSQGLKERYTFNVFTSTSFEDIELLRKLLEDWVRLPDNKRDFQPNIDIKLMALGDMKALELQVEFKHKSNWAIDSVRHARRCKFMCALLSGIRTVPIEAPGGDGPFPRTSANPDYLVTVTPEQHKQFKADFDEKKAKKRLVSIAEDDEEISNSTLRRRSVAARATLEVLPSVQSRKGSLAAL